MVVGKKKNCRIALENMNNPMCYVNDDFHCMILLDERKIPFSDPPFLNRFEKQILTFDEVLSPNHKSMAFTLKKWLKKILIIKQKSKSNTWKKKSSMLIQ